MSIPKFESFKLGPGNINNPSGESQFYPVTSIPLNSFGKDGDIAVNTSTPGGVFQRMNGIWQVVSALLVPLTVNLNDGQIGSTNAFQYSAVVFPYAKIQYTLRRGSDETQKRQGTLVILSDSNSNTSTTLNDERIEFGGDVGVTLTISVSGGIVSINYTSTAQGIPLQLKYLVSGW